MRSTDALAAFLALVSLGCAITNYPVILDSRGPWGESVLEDQYEQAYIRPSAQVATIWSDGSDEIYTLVSQDWKGDQWLKTYANFDSTAAVLFLDQTYCDPNRQTRCVVFTAWNPDLPESYEPATGKDDVWDGTMDESCSGARSLSGLVSYQSRLVGECGSGLLADRQDLAYEFSMLDRVRFRGQDVYEVPIDATNTTVVLTSLDGASENAPIYGRSRAFIDDRLRMIWPVDPIQRYSARWSNRFIDAHGGGATLDVTYGSIRARYDVKLLGLDESRF